MGFKITYVACRDIDREYLFKRLKLTDTGKPDPDNESPFSGAELPNGWYLIWSNNVFWGANEGRFVKLSTAGDIIVSIVDETSMTFAVTYYSGGNRTWSVVHDAQNDLRHLAFEGNLPPTFDEIKTRNIALQDTENSSDPYGVDYYANIPPELFASIVGFKYDESPTIETGPKFTTLKKTIF